MKETRRIFIKKLGYSVAVTSLYAAAGEAVLAAKGRPAAGGQLTAGPPLLKSVRKRYVFDTKKDRVWIGEDFCAVPMEDWSIRAGKVRFNGAVRNSRLHILTTRIRKGAGRFRISAFLGIEKAGIEKAGNGRSTPEHASTAGFSIGINDVYDDDVKAACYYGSGLPVGISTAGYLIAGEHREPLPEGFSYDNIKLECEVDRGASATLLKVTASSAGGQAMHELELDEDLPGYLALINNIEERGEMGCWFRDLEIQGEKLSEHPEQSFGPILWTMHTLHQGQLKMSVQMPPLAADDNRELTLLVREKNKWKEIQRQPIDPASCLAIFKLDNWDTVSDRPYRVVYRSEDKTYHYDGTVRKAPNTGQLRLGGLTCQHWQAYPYSPLVKNLAKYDPDMLFFSGDQIYEGNGGYGIKRAPADQSILNYLGKWFMFGWAFGSLMRDRPTVCTPDDHDVFHGNLWGDNGDLITMEEWETRQGVQGGYVQSPEMVNVVHSTNCGHLPDCPEPGSLPSGISAWYTEIVYGGVSFAIISDRMFKSGPADVRTAEGRIDHIKAPPGPGALERQDLQLLGKRQTDFLNRWISAWEGASMKVLLSQTLFAGVGTHHGDDKMFLYGDMDSGGWPKQQRDEVIRILRKGYAFHVNGDQHLPFIVQYSVDGQRDGGWTFCTPAISTGYIRWGQPDLQHTPFTDRPGHNLPNTGCYQDIFGNYNYIYAVGNPLDDWRNDNRYQQAQNKSSGFGIITFDVNKRTIRMDAYRFLSDKDRPSAGDQFPGWPLEISQTDNDGRKFPYLLPTLKLNKENQVVRVFSSSGELVSALRLKGSEHQFGVPDNGGYYLEVGEGDRTSRSEALKGREGNGEVLEMEV